MTFFRNLDEKTGHWTSQNVVLRKKFDHFHMTKEQKTGLSTSQNGILAIFILPEENIGHSTSQDGDL